MKQLALIAVLGIAVLTNGCAVYPTPYGPGVSLEIPVAPVYGPYYDGYPGRYYGGYPGRYYGGYPGRYYGGYPGRYYGGYHHHRW